MHLKCLTLSNKYLLPPHVRAVAAAAAVAAAVVVVVRLDLDFGQGMEMRFFGSEISEKKQLNCLDGLHKYWCYHKNIVPLSNKCSG